MSLIESCKAFSTSSAGLCHDDPTLWVESIMKESGNLAQNQTQHHDVDNVMQELELHFAFKLIGISLSQPFDPHRLRQTSQW